MEFLDLPNVTKAGGSIALPGSKSISNRTLLLAALSEGQTTLTGLLDSDDTRVMLTALRALGVTLSTTGTQALVAGVNGPFPVKSGDLFMGNAGTAIRPLTAALALSSGSYTVDGVARMRERPIGDLVDGLRAVGAAIDYRGTTNYPPLAISPAQIAAEKPIKVRGDVSSQFLTALLMALPLVSAAQAIRLEVVGELISKPYIHITLELMARFGVVVERKSPEDPSGWRLFTIPQGSRYTAPGTLAIEGDASSASYFLAAGAIGGGPVRVEGVGAKSIQGDVRFAEALEAMGATIVKGDHFIEASGVRVAAGEKLKAIDADFNHIPDAAMTLAVLALFADGPSRLSNIGSWRVKETDRITAMATELRKLGAAVEEGTDFIRITPPATPTTLRAAAIDTYDDHRMAMCFSLASFGSAPIRINDPACVNKTFPDYFKVFGELVQ